MIIGWLMKAGPVKWLGVALVAALGWGLLEHAWRTAAEAKVDALGLKVLQANDAVAEAKAINQRQAAAIARHRSELARVRAERDAQAVLVAKRDTEARAVAAKARARDAVRRARPDLPSVDEMNDALRDAAAGL